MAVRLIEAGYSVKLQWQVCQSGIDRVVPGNGAEDIARQAVLERLERSGSCCRSWCAAKLGGDQIENE